MSVAVHRLPMRLMPDPRRVIIKPYLPAEQSPTDTARAELLVARALAIPEADVPGMVQALRRDFAWRHDDYEYAVLRDFESVAHLVPPGPPLTQDRKLLVGAYFSHEYSLEAAALFNPSIVPAPDQSGVPEGSCRFILSLRSVGEGHISSIQFRTGIVDGHGAIAVDPPSPHLMTGRRTPPRTYDKHLFANKLAELGVLNDMSAAVLEHLPDRFSLPGLESSLSKLEQEGPPLPVQHETTKIMRVLAASNYVSSFDPSTPLAARVIFPAGPHETRGMEDARFVRFVDQGQVRYYATYTAYDGFEILPQLIETEDFVSFHVSTLNGQAAQNKGMALFPRKVGGLYLTLSRRDRENLHLASSTDVRFWNEVTELRRPVHPWELLNIGNCGSPVETEAGWLVLTHGVGPMRSYSISAILLDLENPARIVGELREPLLWADKDERDGYVPNVVYTCGLMIVGDCVVLPYGFSDYGVAFATLSLRELLAELLASPPAH